MSRNHFEEYSYRLRRSLANTPPSDIKYRQHGIGYLSSTLVLPEYYKAIGFDEMSLKPLTYGNDRSNIPRRTMPIHIVTPKGKMSWRRFGIMHPYSYWHICNEVNNSESWRQILDILCEETGVSVYSVPPLYSPRKPQGSGISQWSDLNKRDLIIDLSNRSYCATTDISNFYPSIYTHSIAWALDGKREARADQRQYRLLGTRMDKLFQNSRDGQTNGILIGSIMSDVVAELILCRIDKSLMESFKANNLDLTAIRFRDDYKFLCSSQTEAELALKIFSRTINDEYDLSVNDIKTKVESDTLLASLRPWDLEARSSNVLSKAMDPKYIDYDFDSLNYILLTTYELQARYPQSRIAVTILDKLARKTERNKEFKIRTKEAKQLVSIIRKLVFLREDVTPHAMLLIDKLLRFVSRRDRRIVIRDLYVQFIGNKDNNYQEAWLYRVCLHHCPDILEELFASTDNPLIKAVITDIPHYQLFESQDGFDPDDIIELEKFKLVDVNVLAQLTGKPIRSNHINAFYPT